MHLQLNNFINSNNKLEVFQSGFWTNHSTETALVKVVNDIRIDLDANKPSVLVLLDLSAAFDIVDHKISLNRLRDHTELSRTVLNWFSSYLSAREFFVAIDDDFSKTSEIPCGVPQGSILGPLLFNLFNLYI